MRLNNYGGGGFRATCTQSNHVGLVVTFVVNLLLEREPLPEKTESNKDGTGEGTRTPTLVKEADFESAASTNSATPAPGARILMVCRSFVNKFVSANLFFYA